MPNEDDEVPWREDLRATTSVRRQALEPFADARWDGPAGELEWSCRTTLVHVLSALARDELIITIRREKDLCST
jgi:hypothetical protein